MTQPRVNDPKSYEEAVAFLRDAKPAHASGEHFARKIANNTYLTRIGHAGHGEAPDAVAVKLHGTDVVTFCKDGTILLKTGGWESVTTKDRMNRFLPSRFRVFAKDFRWMVTERHPNGAEPEVQRPFADVLYLDVNADPGRGIITAADLARDEEI